MIIQLKYNLKFTSTGRSFSQDIKFKPGLTVITGRNEMGKSLILEMIEYAWFGSQALRGQASDYEILNVEMIWETKGENHTVKRNGARQTLDTDKAIGATAVNQAILKILGIGLDVFRISCSAKQGELDKLTARMAPTERRRMVDSVIGLNQLEKVEKLCKEEANSHKRLRDDLVKRLIEPVEIEEPEGYIPSVDLEILYKEQLKSEAERDQLVKINQPTLPEEPTKGEFNDDVTMYETLRSSRESERAGIERSLRAIPTASCTQSDLQRAKDFYEQERRGAYPSISRSDCERFLNQWATLDRLSHAVHCPKCGADFVPGEGEDIEMVEEPPLTRKELAFELKQLDAWEGYEYQLIERPTIREDEIQEQEVALAQQDIREKLKADLASIPAMESRADELAIKDAWEKANNLYKNQCDIYVEKLTNWSDAQARLAELPDTDPNLEINLQIMRNYEEQKRRYDADAAAYSNLSVELEKLNAEAEAYNKGAEALKIVRSQVKQHLVPSLNKVASYLLSEMTDGQRKKITVDENFEVSVDGQPVRTLSGSGISVVNLSLRIALGQILTQKVIPVFLGDELDADCDPDRAAGINKALMKVSKTLKQVIVVSHKPILGDNTINI